MKIPGMNSSGTIYIIKDGENYYKYFLESDTKETISEKEFTKHEKGYSEYKRKLGGDSSLHTEEDLPDKIVETIREN